MERKGKCVVLGSFNADMICRFENMPAPGQTVFGSKFAIGPGGKGSNQAVAAKKAGGDVSLVAKLGRDVFADVALNLYKQIGLGCQSLVFDDKGPTGTALILVNDNTSQNSIIVYSAANFAFSKEDIEASLPVLNGADIFLTQLENNLEATSAFITAAKAAGVRVVLNPAPAVPLDYELFKMVDVITPNETEAEVYTGIPSDSYENIRLSAKWFLGKGVKNVVITLGERGVYATDGVSERFLPALILDAPVVDTTGAGDCFAGSLCVALAEGKDLFGACLFGGAAAALACRAFGAATAMPERVAIDKALGL